MLLPAHSHTLTYLRHTCIMVPHRYNPLYMRFVNNINYFSERYCTLEVGAASQEKTGQQTY